MKIRTRTFLKTFTFMSFIFGVGAVQAASQISILQEIFAFTVYALIFSLYTASEDHNILGRLDKQKALSRLSIAMSIIMATMSISIVFSEGGVDISRLFERSRELRHSYFENTRSEIANYFVLLMSSHLTFFIALCAAASRSKGAVCAVFLASFLIDSVTSGRSGVLASIIAIIFFIFVYHPLGIKSILILALFAAGFISFAFLGQGDIAVALQVRLLNYISAPIYLSDILDDQNPQWAATSIIEFLTYPFKIITGSAIFSFDTSHEYDFYWMPSGQIGNVVLPIYGGITGIFPALMLFLSVSGLLLLLRGVSLIANRKSQKIIYFLLTLSFFGPISLMRSPFLAERIWFLFVIILLLSRFRFRLLRQD